MKLFLMVETKNKLSKKEQEELCWKMMEGTDVYNMVARETLEELNSVLSEQDGSEDSG